MVIFLTSSFKGNGRIKSVEIVLDIIMLAKRNGNRKLKTR